MNNRFTVPVTLPRFLIHPDIPQDSRSWWQGSRSALNRDSHQDIWFAKETVAAELRTVHWP